MRFALHSTSTECTSSAVVVDWLGAGRIAKGERWAFRDYKSSLEFVWTQNTAENSEEVQRLIDSMAVTSEDFMTTSGCFDAAVSIFAVGPRAAEVSARLERTASLLASRVGARVAGEKEGEALEPFPELAGGALMGVTKVERCTAARLMAERSEDIYRILHHCLSPLSTHIGVEPYADRVHGLAQISWAPAEKELPRKSKESEKRERVNGRFDLKQSLILCQLTDATLPVGGFAHSNGIEAASQLGLLKDVESLRSLVFSGALSTLRLQGHFVKLAHGYGDLKTEAALKAWRRLDSKLAAYLASNGVASRASSLQGAGLLRVGKQWQREKPMDAAGPIWPRKGHYATCFGLLCARWGVERW